MHRCRIPVLVIIGLDSLVSPVNNCIRAIDPSSPLSSRSSLSTERVEGVRRGANSRFISVGENSCSFVASFLLFFFCKCKEFGILDRVKPTGRNAKEGDKDVIEIRGERSFDKASSKLNCTGCCDLIGNFEREI